MEAVSLARDKTFDKGVFFMPDVFDFKKAYKDLYLPKTKPMLIDVPKMTFIMIDGKGNPNTVDGEFQKAVEALYGLSYTIKMSKMGKNKPQGYFEYVVPPLEGFWWFEDEKFDERPVADKEKMQWTAMIRQPDFVTAEVLLRTKEARPVRGEAGGLYRRKMRANPSRRLV
jgi:hypothetical protein